MKRAAGIRLPSPLEGYVKKTVLASIAFIAGSLVLALLQWPDDGALAQS